MKKDRGVTLQALRAAMGRTLADVACAGGMDLEDIAALEGRTCGGELEALKSYASALGGHAELAIVIDGRLHMLDI